MLSRDASPVSHIVCSNFAKCSIPDLREMALDTTLISALKTHPHTAGRFVQGVHA